MRQKKDKKITKYDICEKVMYYDKDGWTGRMSAKEQREIFGEYLFGKKKFTIDCNNQGRVYGSWKVCFGHDFNTFDKSFNEIAERINIIKSGKSYYLNWIG